MESLSFSSEKSYSPNILTCAADIDERGISLKVLTQNIDTTTPEGRLFFHMTAAFDEFQRELIVENTRAGLKAANKRGRRGGRPKVLNEQGIKKGEATQRHKKLSLHRRCH
ncbi:recombinase family protein [Candidatus Vondammii sp. HM_W22]|uniref:recombinase family protein n=1 Tax=Candidatus Vondammii sp. HM_W22 TaxID=2687299 RepID=UPI001F12C1CF|nr:recombinase family protein [Candidatus Vondammii sp. HM_W22]